MISSPTTELMCLSFACVVVCDHDIVGCVGNWLYANVVVIALPSQACDRPNLDGRVHRLA